MCCLFQLVDLTLTPTFCYANSAACVSLYGFLSTWGARLDSLLVPPASCGLPCCQALAPLLLCTQCSLNFPPWFTIEMPCPTAVWFHLPVAGPPAAKLQLSQQRLTEFGGMREVVHQFKAAPCNESRCNMLSVMLDHVAWNLSEVRPALQKQAASVLWAAGR